MQNYQKIEIIEKEEDRAIYKSINNLTNELVAIKKIMIKSKEEMQDLIEKVTIMKNLKDSKYVPSYREHIFKQSKNGIFFINIVTDFVEGVTLEKYLIKNYDNKIQFPLFYKFVKQMLLGLQYIHNKNYAHRDIHSENIMITNENDIKYIDFDQACLIGNCYINVPIVIDDNIIQEKRIDFFAQEDDIDNLTEMIELLYELLENKDFIAKRLIDFMKERKKINEIVLFFNQLFPEID